MPSTRFILVRHGETEWNTEEREMGQLDSPLTARGLRQAELLAKRLASIPFAALYSSDLPRARRTAEAIAAVKGLPIREDVRLRERNMGIFQGYTVPEMREKFPVERGDYERIGFDYVVPGGESGRQRLERTVACLDELAGQHPEETLLCVTHGGILMGFLQFVLGMDPASGWRFKRPNAAINVFERKDGRWIMESWGDVGHLDREIRLDDPHSQEKPA